MSWRHREAQWIAKPVHAHVNLGAESSPASAQGLRRLPPLFRCACSALASAGNRTVDDEIFHVWLFDEVLAHSLPDAPVAPQDEALVDGVPIAVLGWKQPPLRP